MTCRFRNCDRQVDIQCLFVHVKYRSVMSGTVFLLYVNHTLYCVNIDLNQVREKNEENGFKFNVLYVCLRLINLRQKKKENRNLKGR